MKSSCQFRATEQQLSTNSGGANLPPPPLLIPNAFMRYMLQSLKLCVKDLSSTVISHRYFKPQHHEGDTFESPYFRYFHDTVDQSNFTQMFIHERYLTLLGSSCSFDKKFFL